MLLIKKKQKLESNYKVEPLKAKLYKYKMYFSGVMLHKKSLKH